MRKVSLGDPRAAVEPPSQGVFPAEVLDISVTDSPCRALSEVLTHELCEQDKTSVYTSRSGSGLSHSNCGQDRCHLPGPSCAQHQATGALSRPLLGG